MKEMVFSIWDIFNDKTQDGCLSQYGCSRYHIPAYQRGYKWASDANGAVSVLLKDLWEAYNKSATQERGEYYLQYITTKKIEVPINGQTEYCLEVIDGQQRLTTLSICLAVLAEGFVDRVNISINKLHYAVREDFFAEYIYNSDSLSTLLQYKSAKEAIEANSIFNKQDIYYITDAAIRCKAFFESKNQHNNIADFYKYLTTSVKLIVNSVEKHIASETVFKNLNTNKVPLTEVELIKALFITKVGRHLVGEKGSFQELLELRANIGRRWDEISNWANSKEINRYFFGNSTDGLESLLQLVAISLSSKKINFNNKSEYTLFNFYQECDDYLKAYKMLLTIYKTLKGWYEDDNLYNYIGFLRFHKGSKHTLSFFNELLQLDTKTELLSNLREKVKNKLEHTPASDLRYDEQKDHNQIHTVLLALSVFGSDRKSRYNFYEFDEQQWSLEHIFPQTPEGKNHILTESEKDVISVMLGEHLTLKIEKLLAKKERTKEEKEIYENALKQMGPLNSIGNLCLMTSRDNTSNGCMFFREKRANVLKRIQQGSFVPKHTFEVFSKMLVNADIERLDSWTRTDIESHAAHIANQLNELKKDI